ncbi:MAG TPA: caspase family protein [Chitinophagales bacterium]|nr:caspase family protein [Chitinophagales bacterium]
MSAKNVFALLIGVNSYPGRAALNGCVADSVDMENYLRDTVAANNLQMLMLRDADATKDNITRGFMEFLTQATQNDVALIHYAGHGSREAAHPSFWHATPDRMNEVLVPVDGISANFEMQNPLADKELKWLIAQVAKKNPHIAVLLDCCHSGDGTRLAASFKSRFTAANQTQTREFDNYVFKNDAALAAAFEQTGQLDIKSGKHILLAACRSNQTAKELLVNGKQRGIFTHSITDALRLNSGKLTYRELIRLTSVKVVSAVQEQVPQLEPVLDSTQANMLFLGGTAARRTYYIVTKNAATGVWEMDAGSINGIVTSPYEPTTMAIYDQTANLDADTALPLTEAAVTKLDTNRSVLQPDNNNLLTANTYKAVPANMPLQRLKVRLEPETGNPRLFAGLAILRAAIATSGSGGKPSVFVEEVDECVAPDYRVVAYIHNGEYKFKVCNPFDDRPLIEQTTGFHEQAARSLVRKLEHIAQWERIRQLQNPASRINQGQVEIVILKTDRNPQTGEWSEYAAAELNNGILDIRYYEYEEEVEDESGRMVKQTFSSPELLVRINNHSANNYFASLYYLGSDFSCTNQLLQKYQLKAQQQDLPTLDGQAISPIVPPELVNLGVSEDKSTLKLLISTDDFNAEVYNLPSLGYARNMRTTLRPSQRQPVVKDWQTVSVVINVIRSFDHEGRKILQNNGVQINFPNGFNATVGISSDKQHENTRTLHRSALPLIPDELLQDLQVSEPVSLIATRGSAPNLNVLELNNIQNPDAVTPQTPITLELPITLKNNETILPLATDGEFYYPLGFATNSANGTSVVLERLVVEEPSKTERATRGLLNTAKIVFHKLIGQKVGFGYEYPYLSVVAVDEKGNLTYEPNKLQVAEKVKTANKIVVITHGITGETRAFLQPDRKKPASDLFLDLQQHYDLVLAFDYDSYSTGIRQTALDFKNRLAEVGLTAQHGKTVHLVAHSMGGLVSRWMIEKEGGNNIIQHLVMLGTPNNGSPWPKVKDWAAWAVTIGLSKITLVGIPLLVLNYLMDGAKKAAALDKVTDDMKPGSELLLSLAQSADPNVPYTVIAGNTTIMLKNLPDATGKLQKILHNLGIDHAHYQVLTQLLFREENDIACSKTSMSHVPTPRTPLPQMIIAACDHMSYFTTPEGKQKLMHTLRGL